MPEVERPTVASAVLSASDSERSLTVAELAVRYIDYCEPNYRQPDGTPTGTHKLVEYAFRCTEPWYRAAAIDFKSPQLVEVRNHIIATGGPQRRITRVVNGKETCQLERKPPSRKYVTDCINRIRTAFRWAAERGLIPGAVAHELAAVRSLRAGRSEGARETPRMEPVADDTFFATLRYLPKVVADVLMVIRLTDAHPGEICLMRPQEITTVDENGKSLQVWLYHPTTRKNAYRGLGREIYLNTSAQEILEPYLQERAPWPPLFSLGCDCGG